MGEALAPFKGEVAIATKFGFKLKPDRAPGWLGLDTRPEHIKQVADASLKRLKVDVIDPFYQHPSAEVLADPWSKTPRFTCSIGTTK